MFTPDYDSAWFGGLWKLAGMANKPAYYTAARWEQITGIDPRRYPSHIQITPLGLCVWTAKAEKAYKAHCRRVADNWQSIGV